jgi:tungstate transport system permease protein
MSSPAESLIEITGLSMRVSGLAVLGSALAGIPLGIALAFSSPASRRWWNTVVQTGMALPPVVVGLLLYLLLSRSGPLGHWQWLYTARAMILAQVILTLPFVIAVTASSVSSVPGELFWQLRVLGATPWQARLAVLKEARSGVLLAVAAAFGRSLSEVGAVMMVGGNIEGHTRVLTTAIVMETRQGDFALALGLSVVLMSVALAINVLIVRAQGRVLS